MSLAVAGTMGVGRSWTAWMISVLSILRRYAEVTEVGVPELALNHEQWDAFAGHLDGVRVTELMRREPAPRAGRLGGAA